MTDDTLTRLREKLEEARRNAPEQTEGRPVFIPEKNTPTPPKPWQDAEPEEAP